MSRRASRSPFEAIRTEGGLLPHDLLQRVAARDPKLPGLRDADLGLLEHERESEVVNRAWTRLLAAWAGFRAALDREPPDAPATTATRDRWLLPLFQELGFGRLSTRRQAFDLDGRAYPISHEHEATRTAVHLLGARVGLDVRTQAVQGAARATPHGLVQDLLNRSDAHLWAIVSNGLVLRLLRDSKSITRQAYVELDLESIFDDQRYSEFRVLWLVCHESRFRREGEAPCLLERWFEAGKQEGVRALDRLRRGVEEAIRALGRGFLRHRDNTALREALGPDRGPDRLDAQEYYRQLLRLVYRLIFLFVSEDRGVLLDPAAPAAARERYTRHYATTHLRARALAARRHGGPHGDLWVRLRLVMDGLYAGCPALGLPALGSFLWRPDAIGLLGRSALANEDLLSALRMLVEVSDGQVVVPVAWAQVGADELGSVYESLLELHPRLERDAGSFELGTAAGHERKTTGSYYTPASLVECLLDSALDPVLDARCRSSNPEAALLELRVCDPACGSGHFLVAAARRIARRLAALRSGDEEPSPEALRHALRDVVGRCLYGVDLNPMAVELCKVSLWLEAVEPGRPLSFLEAHVQVGNSLLGTTPALLAQGLPDEAFDPIEGDDKAVCKRLKKLHRDERKQRALPFGQGGVSERLAVLAAGMEAIEREADASLAGIEAKARRWEELRASEALRRATLVADAWCAAFVWPKVEGDLERAAPTHDVLARLATGERLPTTEAEVARLAREYAFLHWHLAFPQVFSVPQPGERPTEATTGWSGGFDVVLGNPPWEKVKLHELEFFASRSPEFSTAGTGAARKRLIAALPREDPPLWAAWSAAKRHAEGQSQFVRLSGRFPLCGRGDVNTYAVFAEHNRSIVGGSGRAGFIVPSGIATDDTTKEYFGALTGEGQLVSFHSFENREALFPAVDRRVNFALLTLAPGRRDAALSDLVFYAHGVGDLADRDRHVTLAPGDFALLNPNTRTCPTFRSRRDAALNLAIYRRSGVLWREDAPDGNPWGLRLSAMFHMTNDSGLFHERAALLERGWTPEGSAFVRGGERMVPLYEAKMLHHYDHRFGDYADKPADSRDTQLPDVPAARLADPNYQPLARYWIPEQAVDDRLRDRWDHGWLLGWRDITNATNERTVVACVFPRVGVGNKFPLLFPSRAAPESACLCANLASFPLDYGARQKVGGTTLNYFLLKQLPTLPPSAYQEVLPWGQIGDWVDFLLPRVLELTYTTWDLEPFARDCGHEGPPFRWEPDRRVLLRAELDAAFFHLYGLSRDDTSYVLDTFPIVRRHDEEAHGEFRTKRLVLEAFDRMAEAARTGAAYTSLVSPPPADPSVAHAPRSATGAHADPVHARTREP